MLCSVLCTVYSPLLNPNPAKLNIPHAGRFQAANHRRANAHYLVWWGSDGYQPVWPDLCGADDFCVPALAQILSSSFFTPLFTK